jgi:hypothetical protein
MNSTERNSGEVITGVVEPGNGTRYEVVATKLPAGEHKGYWAILFPQFGTGYVFAEGSFVSYGYVDEKLNRGNRLGEGDLLEMCRIIASITGSTSNAPPRPPPPRLVSQT